MLVKEEMDVVDFRIAIVTTDSRSYVSNFFRLQVYTRLLKDTNVLNEDQIKAAISAIDSTTSFITSARAGLGKTQHIKRKADQEGKKLYLFPIAGEITYDRLGRRLGNLQLEAAGDSILCLQINFVDNM